MRKCASALSVVVLMSVLVYFQEDVMCQEANEANLVDAALVESDIEVLDSMEERFQPLIPHQSSETELKILAEVNVLRAKHHSAPLIIDGDLAGSAQGWADHLAGEGRLIPSCSTNRCCYGENLAITGPSNDMYVALNITVDYWYRQVDDYDYKKMKARPDTSAGAFTALVWKGSKRLGIGTAVSKKDKKIFIVFQFAPTGNMEGDYKRNVREPTSYENSDIYEIQQVTLAPPVFSPDSFQITILGLINQLRAKHHVLPVVLDNDMTTESQKFTEEMAMTGKITQSCKSGKCPYTENNAMTSPRKTITEGGLKAVMTWYNEISNYDFPTGKPKESMVIKDFTNLVWKGVQRVGIGGTVKESNGFIYILVQFAPAANIPDYKGAKVTTKKPPVVATPAPRHDNWQIKVLMRINQLRAKHRSPPLGLDPNMTFVAQKLADDFAAAGKLEPSCKTSNCSYIENQGVGPPNKDMATGVKGVVNLWYDKNKAYDYPAGKGKGTGEFTAMVWKGTKTVGIGGTVKLPDGTIYVVLQFSPPGNVEGEYHQNVLNPAGPAPYEVAAPPLTVADKERNSHEFQCAADDPCSTATAKAKPVTDYQQAGLDTINALRRKHKVPPVCLDETLNENAMTWAKSLTNIGKLEISCLGYDCCYCELQIARAPNVNVSAEVASAIHDFYDQIKAYNFTTGKSNFPKQKMVIGFTALVWKESTRVGIGAFTRPSNEILYVVIEFSPPGNRRGQFLANVFPSSK